MLRFMATVGVIVIGLAIWLVAPSAAWAQGTTATISGTVKDSSGGVLAGAQIEVLNEDTGLARQVVSDTSGRYSAALLPLGNYKVTAKATGLQTEVRSGIVLTVGREAVVDMALSVGATTQTVEVRAEAVLIDTTSATIQGLVSGEQIRELPLNGRSYTDLALLNPGVIYNRNTGSSASDGYGVRMSVNGARANNNLFLMDGTMTNDTSQTAGTVNAGSLGVEGIREFTVLTHNYSAEYGHRAGGVVNAVTRSGTNQFHGSLYEFLRNNKLDARDFFQPGETAAFRRNQFGGAIGGPIKKDAIFFFSNYEGFRQSLAIPVIGNVPNALARTGVIPVNGVLTNVGVSPKIVPYLNLYPVPTPGMVDQGDGTAQWVYSFKQPITENYYMERGDFRLSSKDNFYVRYIFDPSDRLRPTAHPYWSTLDNATNHFSQIGETHVFSPSVVNDVRFAFNRTDRHTAEGPVNSAVAALITPQMSFVPGQNLGRLNFSNSAATSATGGGLAVMGNLNATPIVNIQNVFQGADTFSIVRGRHSFKTGFDLQRIQTNTYSAGGVRGSWTFGGLQSFLTAQPTDLDAGRVLGVLPSGGLSTVNFGWRQWVPSWFVQDDWKISSRLTLNLGLRHEFTTDPMEVNGNSATLRKLTDTQSTIGPAFTTTKMNIAPRFGMAWDPTGSGKTSVRLGVGTFFNQVNIREAGPPADYRYSATYTLTCNWSSATNPCATFPYVPANPPLSTAKSESAVSIGVPLETPTVTQYGLDVQRQLTTSTTIRVGYVGWNGYNLVRSRAANERPFDPVTGLYNSAPRPNPAFGNITEIVADTVANYHSLQVDFRQSLTRGLAFQVAYTYGKTLSEADSSANRVIDNAGNSYISMIATDPSRDYGRSGYDQRHVVVINAQYQLPLPAGLNNGASKAVLGGWTVSGIWQYGSGLPLNVNTGFSNSGNNNTTQPDRPDVAAGFSNNPTSGVTSGCPGIPSGQALKTPNRWYDPCAFSLPARGKFGNVARNTMDGPGTNVLNFTLGKTFRITERVNLQFRAESFNLFNHPQFGIPALFVFQSDRSRSGSAGTITSTNNPGLGGRNIQFGLRLTF